MHSAGPQDRRPAQRDTDPTTALSWSRGRVGSGRALCFDSEGRGRRGRRVAARSTRPRRVHFRRDPAAPEDKVIGPESSVGPSHRKQSVRLRTGIRNKKEREKKPAPVPVPWPENFVLLARLTHSGFTPLRRSGWLCRSSSRSWPCFRGNLLSRKRARG